ncbi:hypothetical protein CP981_32980 [Streptomyces platensis]|uniref:Uncharacterized protein n=1 Tax=Streptomyces platensis TaxID=58346 RepID=A0AAE6NME2_STRPT|nr:hypothetical protein CP981_32980 [Streptomyces platensis]
MQPTAVVATATARLVAIEVALDIVSSFPRGRCEPNIPGTSGIKNDALSDHLDGQSRRDSPLDGRENPPLGTELIHAPVMS